MSELLDTQKLLKTHRKIIRCLMLPHADTLLNDWFRLTVNVKAISM